MRHLQQIMKSERAAVFPLVAIILFALVAVVAITVDIARVYSLQNKAQQASDAALLGAVATLNTNKCADNDKATTHEALVCETRRLFESNIPTEFRATDGSTYMNSTLTNMIVSENTPSAGYYQLDFDLTIPYIMMGKQGIFGMRNLGLDPLTFHVLSQVARGLDKQPEAGIELTLVLDTTDSMKRCEDDVTDCNGQPGSKLSGLKSAVNTFLDNIYADKNTLPNLWVSVVPYQQGVNVTNYDPSGAWIQTEQNKTTFIYHPVGDGGATEADGVTAKAAYWQPVLYSDKIAFNAKPGLPVIVEDRHIPGANNFSFVDGDGLENDYEKKNNPSETINIQRSGGNPIGVDVAGNGYDNNGLNVSDTAPVTGNDSTLFHTVQYYWYKGYRPSIVYGGGGCTISPMIARKNDKASVKQLIDSLQASCATRINVGLTWGLFTLSSNWSGIWGNGTTTSFPAAPDALVKKVMILMTDGVNEKPNHPTVPEVPLRYRYDVVNDTTAMQNLCADLRAKGVDLYTIAFGAGADQAGMKACVNNNTSHYAYAATNAQLLEIFKGIGDKLQYDSIRLTQ